jgi:putative salt-induced outer membrane protein YdiY
MRRSSLLSAAATVPLLVLALAAPAQAQDKPAQAPDKPAPAPDKKDEKKLGWSDQGELGYVATSGNSESSTFGLKNTLARDWERSRFELKIAAVRVETTTRTVTAVGTPTDFSKEVDTNTETTAENYFASARYDKNITDRFFWFGGAGWDRNRFAGIDNRYTAFGGVGNIWFDSETWKWRTDYSLTATRENDVVEPPNFDDTFAGARLSSSLRYAFSHTGTYTNDTIVDENLDHSTDWRVNMNNSVQLSMSTHLALKVSLQELYDHQPALVNAPLFDTTGAPVDANGDGVQDQVAVKAETLDSIFTTALVIKY